MAGEVQITETVDARPAAGSQAMESFNVYLGRMEQKPLIRPGSVSLSMGVLGAIVGAVVSVVAFILWNEQPLFLTDEPLLGLVLQWLMLPWGYGFAAGWLFTGNGIVAFIAGPIAMGFSYAIVGFCIELTIKVARRLFLFSRSSATPPSTK
jgi:hypothetical protein